MLSHFAWLLSLALLSAGVLHTKIAAGATFSFGGSQNAFNGQSSATLAADGFELHLATTIAGSKLNEPQGAGMGVDSQGVAGAVDPSAALFNVIGGSGPLAGTREAIDFSFNQAGILTGINFDGVKDESLEYFILTTPTGGRVNFFDSAANVSVAGAVDAAIADGAVTGQVVYLLEISSLVDDEALGLSIPFAAGEQFRLEYSELGDAFHPSESPNGARLQGITVITAPEPATWWLLVAGCILAIGRPLCSRVRWRIFRT